jgi:hypothetical protein
MAEWKKVVVSGSDISQLNNDSNYIADGDSSVSISGSFSGSFQGDGSGLTGLPAAAISAYNNAADNRVITSVDSSTVQGEANLTFNGSTLGVTGNITVTGTVDGVNVSQLETDFNTLEGKTLISSSAQITYGDSADQAVEGNTNITINVASGELTRDVGNAAQALGGAPSYTLGLADTISGNRTFSGQTITFNNDIVVQGTASFQNSTNLEVADQFILLNSGSTTDNSPGGIIIQQNTQDEGVAFAYDAAADSNNGRWGTTDAVNASGTTFSADAYVSYVVDIDAGQSDVAKYQQNGNIKVDSGDIFIYA